MPKKLPYGQSNFADLIERGYAYVDKTRYIELLENENNGYQFFIRPRRFGKSLWLSILENYYGIGKPDAIFKDLYIGKNPTPEKNKYAV
ncbi:MAG: AAA family ATPase, partial [Fibromonadaceae bacterium]|nr:AAA family ATPase [Fibromonadaceae bacterium]